MLSSWLTEYDDLSADAESSSYQTYQLNLQRWLDAVDDHPVISAYIAAWERTVDFAAWYRNTSKTVRSTVGSGRLEWPKDGKQRLGLQIGLFRALAGGEIQIHDFANDFFFTENHFRFDGLSGNDTTVSPFVTRTQTHLPKAGPVQSANRR